jgi:hypothetical protein
VLSAPFPSSAQKVIRFEASTKILRIPHKSEENLFEGIVTGDESSFQWPYPSSEMFAWSPTDVIPRTRQAIGTRKSMITIFFTGRKLIVLNILPKGSKFNQLCFVDYIFLDFKRQKMNFHREIPQATFWVHVDNSMWHNESKVALKFKKYHVSRLPHPPYSPDMNPSDFGSLEC